MGKNNSKERGETKTRRRGDWESEKIDEGKGRNGDKEIK